MSNLNDERVLNAILNPNTPFDDKSSQPLTPSKYEITPEIQEAKNIEVEETETLEILVERHRKEKKDLQSKVQALKKTVTKGDKKKKKEVETEIEKLEKDFENKCQLEVQKLTEKSKTKLEVKTEEPKHEPEDERPEKNSRSKKRRDKKDNKEQEREKAIALQEIENQKGPAAIELKKIKEKLMKKNLRIKEVISDGNCMYYAVADQIQKNVSMSKNYQELRDLTCDYMLRNPDEFQPYLTNDDGDFLDSEMYQDYCNKIKTTSVWGGQLELKALSDILGVKIEVVQAEGSEIVIGEDKKTDNHIIITFHRHMLGSGEHYNSTEGIKEDDDKI